MFIRQITSLAAAVLGAALVAGCGKSVQSLDQVVFTAEPLKQIQMDLPTFRQLPEKDLKVLLAYLGANEKAKLEQKQHSTIEGKPLPRVLDESRTWGLGMLAFLEKSQQVSAQLGKLVTVTPAMKVVENNESTTGKSQIVRISYQLDNKSGRTLTGVAGVIRYLWPDGRLAATIPLTFDGKINPGEVALLLGHQPILVGSGASKEMLDFAKAPLSELRFEVTMQAIRLEDGQIVSIPLL